MVTSKDVARHAGVSRATVSAVVNKNKFVSEILTNKVLKAIEELNYKPDAIARSLKVKTTRTIGVIIPNISSPVFSHSVRGIEDYANKKGYNIILSNSDENAQKEKEIIDIMLEKRVDGLILIPSSFDNLKYLKKDHIFGKKPIVFLDRKIEGIHADTVMSDNKEAAFKLTELLIRNGYRKIAIITHSLYITPGIERLEGYKESLVKGNIEINEDYIQSGGSTKDDGYLRCKKIFEISKIRPDSLIVSSNHLMLLGALKYMNEKNIKIPEDIGIAGWDNLPWLNYLNPPLTVNALPMYEMGEKSAEIIIDRIQEEEHEYKTKEVLFKSELIIRKSIKLLNK